MTIQFFYLVLIYFTFFLIPVKPNRKMYFTYNFLRLYVNSELSKK